MIKDEEVPATRVARVVGLGILAAALFSATFVLNRAMSLAGGHWVWSATVRYFFMIPLLAGWIVVRQGRARLVETLRLFWRQLPFWTLTGGIGYGLFYSCICYAADHSSGWIVAATWQSTILAAPLVLLAFGTPVPRAGIAFAILIFAGIVMIEAQDFMAHLRIADLLGGSLPVLVAAFAYPIGNQLVSRARHRPGSSEVLRSAACCVLLLTLGALPFLILLILVAHPPPPSQSQVISSFGVAVVSGCMATPVFLAARNASHEPFVVSAVDATQAAEVVFALIAEVLILSAPLPHLIGWLGLGSIVLGLVGFSLSQSEPAAVDVGPAASV